MTLFESILMPGGLLVFTTHGIGVAEEIQEARAGMESGNDQLTNGIRPEKLDAWMQEESYGTSVATPAWVCTKLTEHPGLRLACYTELGWHAHQDAIACVHI